jgi:hypothetical protein
MCMPCWVFASKWFCKENKVYDHLPPPIAAIIFEYFDTDTAMEISLSYNQKLRGVPNDLLWLDSECTKCFETALRFRNNTIYSGKFEGVNIILNRKHPYQVRIWSLAGDIDITIGEYDFYSILAHNHAIPDNGTVKSINYYSYRHEDCPESCSLISHMASLIIDIALPYKPGGVNPKDAIFSYTNI